MKPSEEFSKANDHSYEVDYEKIVTSGGFFARWVYRKSHRALEDFVGKSFFSKVLELGAQADQHRPFVRPNFHEYIVSDLNLELLLSQKKKNVKSLSDAETDKRVSFKQIDALDIPYPDSYFDRVIATCLIAHLPNPEDALFEWRRVVRNGGRIDFYVACEPGIILRVARSLTHKRVRRVSSYPYDLLEYSQHRNHFPAINEFVKFVYKKDKIKRKFFPFPFFGWNSNLWAIFSIEVSK